MPIWQFSIILFSFLYIFEFSEKKDIFKVINSRTYHVTVPPALITFLLIFTLMTMCDSEPFFVFLVSLSFIINFSALTFSWFHRAVSSRTALLSYSHTVLSLFNISGISASSSGRPTQTLVRAFGPRLCIAMVDGGGGCVPLIVIVCDIFLTPAIVPP